MILAEIVSMEALNDSIAKVIPIIESIDAHSAPVPFTYINIAIAFTAALIGLFGANYGRKAYIYSQKTAENVSRRSQETQKMLFEEFIKDIQRNFVRIVELEFLRTIKEEDIKDSHLDLMRKKDITEDHLASIRLHDAEAVFTPEVYNQEPEKYKIVRDLLCQVKIYSEAISFAQSRITNSKEIEDYDITNIAKRNIHILTKSVSAIPRVINSEYDYISKMVKLHVEFLEHDSSKECLKNIDANDVVAKRIKECLQNNTLSESMKELKKLFNKCYDTYYKKGDEECNIPSLLTDEELSKLGEGKLKERLTKEEWTKKETWDLLLDLICYSAYVELSLYY